MKKKLSILAAGACLAVALYGTGKHMDRTKPTPISRRKTQLQQTNTKV